MAEQPPAGVKVTTIRFPHPLRQRLDKAAQDDHRTFTGEVLALLESALDARDREKATR